MIWNTGDETLDAEMHYAEAIERLRRSERPYQSRREHWRGVRESISFALFGFSGYRIRRWLKLKLARDEYTQ
jgi:hypothetical protein